MIGPIRRVVDQRDALLAERDALAARVREIPRTPEITPNQPETRGEEPNHEQETGGCSRVNGIPFPRDAAQDYLPDVSSLNWLDLAELGEAVHRRSLLCEYAYHLPRAIQLSDRIARYLPRQPITSNFRIFELGSGHINPFAVALRFYLNGYDHLVAGDFHPLYRPYIAARWMYDAALHAIAFPARWVFEKGELNDRTLERVRCRARSLPLEQLSNGDFDSLGAMSRRHFDYVQLQADRGVIAFDSIDFMYSIAVLEHIMDPAKELAWQYNILRPGAGHFLVIGLEDHRFLDSPGEFRPWTFMLDGVYGPEKPIRQDLQINGLRSSQYRKLLEDTGFIIELWEEETVHEIPSDLDENVLPEFRSLPLSDLATFRVTAFVRRPRAG
jgi:SAM-dependent methyltransferase